MLPTGKEISARTALVFSEMNAWVREEFKLPNFKSTYKLTGRSDRSWARDTYIQLGVESLLKREVVGYVEYKSFNYYLEVGGFKTDDWRLWLDAVIAHEMAHVVHNAICDREGFIKRARGVHFVEGLGRFDTQPHGNTFLAIYKRLRNRFINARVPREAYTGPRRNFADPQGDAIDKGFSNIGKPLEGCVVFINRNHYVIQGFKADSRRDYAWVAKCPRSSRIVNLKLVDIAHTPEARKIIIENSALKAMYEMAQRRHETRRQAAATRRTRRSYY